MSTEKKRSVLQITNWPLRQQTPFVCAVAFAIVLLAALAATMMHNRVAGVIAFLVLVITTWRMWVPVRFRLDTRGVQQTIWIHRARIPWSRIARYELDPNGVLLLHQNDAFPLSALRGTYIHSQENREELIKLLEHYCPSQSPPHLASEPSLPRTLANQGKRQS